MGSLVLSELFLQTFRNPSERSDRLHSGIRVQMPNSRKSPRLGFTCAVGLPNLRPQGVSRHRDVPLFKAQAVLFLGKARWDARLKEAAFRRSL